ncbi:hypothetical protein K457DRAFT_1869927 [Linnemannia elongata AG-77]|nr:hypothetical protein K457DRAFT_1869927 [Linnemannia elongata AG-77]
MPGHYDPYDDDLDDNLDDEEFNTQELLLQGGGLWTDAPPASNGEEEDDDDDGYVSPTTSYLTRRQHLQVHAGDKRSEVPAAESVTVNALVDLNPANTPMRRVPALGRSVSSPQLNSPPPTQVRGGQKRPGNQSSQQTPQKTPRRSPRLNTIQRQLLSLGPSSMRRTSSSSSVVAAQPIPDFFDDAVPNDDAPCPPPSLREAVRSSHRATEEWYTLYESMEYGSIPLPDRCADAPPSQKPLTDVPHATSLRKRSVLGHFYTSNDDSFV